MGVKPFGNVHVGSLSSLHGVSSSASPCTFFDLLFCFMFFGFGHSLLLHISPKYPTPYGKPRKSILVEWGSIAWSFSWPACLSFLIWWWCGVGGTDVLTASLPVLFLPTIFMAENSGWIGGEKQWSK